MFVSTSSIVMIALNNSGTAAATLDNTTVFLVRKFLPLSLRSLCFTHKLSSMMLEGSVDHLPLLRL